MEVGIKVDIQTGGHTIEVLHYILGQSYHIRKGPNTGAEICQPRQYKAMVQECNTRLCPTYGRISAEPKYDQSMMLKRSGRVW